MRRADPMALFDICGEPASLAVYIAWAYGRKGVFNEMSLMQRVFETDIRKDSSHCSGCYARVLRKRVVTHGVKLSL